MLRHALSRAVAASAAVAPAAGAWAAFQVQGRTFSTAPAVSGWAEVADFEKQHGDAVRADLKKMFAELKMDVPAAVAEGRPVGELLDSINDAFMGELALPDAKLKEAYSMRSKIREAFAKQEEELVPKFKEIDWEGFRAALGDDAAIVDKFKAALEKTLSDPALNSPALPSGPDPLMETVAEAEKAMAELAAAVAADVKESEAKLIKLRARAKEIEEEIAAIEKGNVTIDQELARYPDIAAKIDKEILEDKW